MVSLADLNPGAQLVYIIAMYISVYPVAISMRNSNIYQVRQKKNDIREKDAYYIYYLGTCIRYISR